MGSYSHDSPQEPAGSRLGADLAAHVESIVRAAEREALLAEQAIADQRRSAEEEARRYLAAARLQVDAEAAASAARVETLSSAARRLSEELTDAVTALRRELGRDAEEALPRTPWPAQTPASQPSRAAEPTPEPTPQPTWSRTGEQPTATEPAAAPTDADRAGGAGETISAAPSAESSSPATGPARHGAEAQDEQPATTNGQEPPVPSAARLVAIEMAVGGSARAEVEQHLRDDLGVADPQPLLDDVFGAASHASSRLAWGEP